MGPPRATAGGFVVSARGALHLLELHRSDMKLPGLTILTRRSDFLRAASARRVSTPAFTLQYRERAPGEAEGIRVGFTCSKKVGNAVARNRAKRRLREAARLVLPAHGRDGFDYVLIGRREVTAARPFTDLLADLEAALEQVHR